MAEKGPNRKVAGSLVALSSAAIVAVYAVGYVRTKRAADRFDFEQAGRRRAPIPPAVVAREEPAPVASASPGLPPVAAPSPEPRATKQPTSSPTPIHAPSPAASASPAGTPLPMASVPSPTATPAQVASAADYESVDGDLAPEPPPPPAVQYRDGTYSGWGSCRHGNVEAEVVIEQGRIVFARIGQCLTRYPCSWIERLVPEVVTHQGLPVSFVSGASESSDAFYYAVMDALSRAK